MDSMNLTLILRYLNLLKYLRSMIVQYCVPSKGDVDGLNEVEVDAEMLELILNEIEVDFDKLNDGLWVIELVELAVSDGEANGNNSRVKHDVTDGE